MIASGLPTTRPELQFSAPTMHQEWLAHAGNKLPVDSGSGELVHGRFDVLGRVWDTRSQQFSPVFADYEHVL